MISGSIFANVRDNQPNGFVDTLFPDLVRQLLDHASETAPADKASQLCISPAYYDAGATRSKASADSWNWFAADIDNKDGNRQGSTINDIIGVMDTLGTDRVPRRGVAEV